MARSSVLATWPLAVFAAAFPLSAQWVPVPALPGPQNRALFTLTPWNGGELLLFGGDVGNPAATEWSWNGLRWQPVTTPVPRRSGHAMARHGSTGELVLFGGQASASSPFFDTWTYGNGIWTQLVVTGGPTLTANLSMAWDPGSGAMVLIGGTAASGYETWRFDGGTWTQLGSFSSPLAYPEVFTDTVRGEVCMFLTGAQGAEVRRLVPAGWDLVATRPGFTPFGRVTFDSDRGRAVSVGLLSGTRYVHEYDGLQIVRVETGTTGVPVPPQFGLAFHPARHETVMVDFLTVGLSRYVADAVPMATPYGGPCIAAGFQLALAPGDSPQPGGSHRLEVSGSGAGNALSLSLLGFSHVQFSGLPLPQPIPLGPLGCLLRVEPTFVNVLGLGLPAQQLVAIPNAAVLLGQRYDAQFASFDLGGSGVLDTSNGLEVQIGRPLPEYVLRESFLSDASRDPLASGDLWSNGAVTPVAVGGDGRHGSFDASAGLSLGNGVYSWNTDNQLIPASSTLTGAPALVTDGRFYFTDFVVPLGTTVRFVGSAPAQVFVRGQVDVRGVVTVDAADLPFYVPTVGTSAGQRVSSFNARGTPATQQVLGQAGGNGGAGGGNGGAGGRECLGSGPIVVGGVNVTDGQPGQDVRVAAGHAYAAAAVGTGGSGSPLHPASGLTASAGAPFIVATLSYRDEFSRGGGGGGYLLPGGAPATPVIPAPAFAQPNNSPAAAGGSAFPLLPFPSNPPVGYSSLEHYLVGGSGGGGGGSHTFGIASVLTDVWMAGHGGSGGGGAVALRAGGQLSVAGSVTARGGAGVLINGDNPASSTSDVDRGVSSPGGGGSGGSVLLQSARSVSVTGGLDTSGGAGSRTANVAVFSLAPTQLNVQAQAGAGSHGFYRLEAGNTVSFTGSGVPAFNPAISSGPLADQDARTGSRSVWLLPASPTLPVYLRYELVVDIGGVTVLFSDDAAVSAVAANDPSGPVLLRFQGAQADPVSGAIVAGTVGPWRTQVAPGAGSLNADRAQALRFDLVVDKTQGQITVRELRVVWR